MEYIEEVARELCKLRGLDPDKAIPHGAKPNSSGYVPDILCYSPQWRLVAEEVATFMQMEQAILNVHERKWPRKPAIQKGSF